MFSEFSAFLGPGALVVRKIALIALLAPVWLAVPIWKRPGVAPQPLVRVSSQRPEALAVQCLVVAPEAPKPVWPRTYWSSKASISALARSLPSSFEKMYARPKAMGMAKRAGWV